MALVGSENMSTATDDPKRGPTSAHCKANLASALDVAYAIREMLTAVDGLLDDYLGARGQTYEAEGELEDFRATTRAWADDALVALAARDQIKED